MTPKLFNDPWQAWVIVETQNGREVVVHHFITHGAAVRKLERAYGKADEHLSPAIAKVLPEGGYTFDF